MLFRPKYFYRIDSWKIPYNFMWHFWDSKNSAVTNTNEFLRCDLYGFVALKDKVMPSAEN